MDLLRMFPPGVDECFSSWIYRCTVKFPWVKFSLEDVGVKGYFDEDYGHFDEDPDFDIGSDYVQEVLSRISLAERDCISFFEMRPGRLLSWRGRIFYCQECITNDVECHMLPCWRKAWCSVVTVFCPIHKRKLSRIFHNCHPHSKGWQAFHDIANHPYNQFIGSRSYDLWESEDVQKVICRLSMRVAEWYSSDHKAKVDVTGDDTASTELFDLILELLTQAPSRIHPGGVSWLFTFAAKVRLDRYGKCYSWLLERGVERVDINQRICGVILTGKILGILSDEEVGELNCVPHDLFPYFAVSNAEIGRVCAGSIGNYDYLQFRVSQLPCSSQKRFHDFLSGLS